MVTFPIIDLQRQIDVNVNMSTNDQPDSKKAETVEAEENVGDHHAHAVIEKADIQGDIDIGARALDGQELNFTVKGKWRLKASPGNR